MICWLSNGEGPLGAGGQHYKPSFVGGVDFEIKIWWGGVGVAEEMTGLPNNCPATPADK